MSADILQSFTELWEDSRKLKILSGFKLDSLGFSCSFTKIVKCFDADLLFRKEKTWTNVSF